MKIPPELLERVRQAEQEAGKVCVAFDNCFANASDTANEYRCVAISIGINPDEVEYREIENSVIVLSPRQLEELEEDDWNKALYGAEEDSE